MLLQTDIYSFGIILFELLAGSVPFPLTDKGERTRNEVMIAHMEKAPPNLLELRKKMLPPTWDLQKREQEMQVPEWLIAMIYKCIEKKPEKRFTNGVELHEFIWKNSIQTVTKTDTIKIFNREDGGTDDQLQALLQENKRLFKEKEQLQQQLLNYQQGKQSSGLSMTTLSLIFIAIVGLSVWLYYLSKDKKTPTKSATTADVKPPVKQTVIGEYKVLAARAYFYTEPNIATKRNAWAIPSGEVIKAFQERNNFIYTQIVNDKGQVSKGWLRKQDLLTVAEWNEREKNNTSASTSPEDVQRQLREAGRSLSNNNLSDALPIYERLAAQKVPEAMYQYANLALQNKNENIACAEAFDLLTAASSQGYTPAKRTLGFLYSFADNEEVLRLSNYYERCTFSKNLSKGSQLLIQAMLQGDTTASRLLDELNLKQ